MQELEKKASNHTHLYMHRISKHLLEVRVKLIEW
jgi:hypothetical protein